MTMQEVRRPPLHPAQRSIYEHSARFRVVSAGRRFGKTRLGTLSCFKTALNGGRAWWVAPTYSIARIGWRTIKNLAHQVPNTEVREGVLTIATSSGGEVSIRSADSQAGLRGEGLDFLVVDETAHLPGAHWAEVWEQALRPALSDRKGRALFISTPRGFNHFYELYRQAETSDEWAAFQFPTSANPFIDPAEIEAARGQLPALTFRQEYLAEFVQLAGALFRRENFSIVDELPEAVRWVRAWDLAASTKTLSDYTVGAKVALHQGGFVIANVVRGRWEWPEAIDVISATARSDGPTVLQGIEAAGMQRGMLQLLQREPALAGIAFRPVEVHADKITRCNPWLARAEQGKVSLVCGAWNAAFLDEVCAFPESTHDDQVDAVSAAVQLIASQSTRIIG